MTDDTLYDSSGQPVAHEDLSLAPVSGGAAATVGFTFTTGANYEPLSDLKLGLTDATNEDGGSVAIELYSTQEANNNTETVIGSPLTALGLVSDSSLSYSTTPVDVPINNNYVLAAHTTYYVVVNGVLGSKAVISQEAGASGTGVSGQYLNIKNSDGSDVVENVGQAGANAIIGEVTQAVPPGYQNIDPSSNVAFAAGEAVNDKGEIIGIQGASTTSYSGYTDNGGVFSNVPSGLSAYYINNDGALAGNQFGPQNNQAAGFVISNSGVVTQVTAPGQVSQSASAPLSGTQVNGLTNGGLIYGSYSSISGVRGFIDNNGVYTDVVAPGAVDTFVEGANDSGTSVGFQRDSFGNTTGFEDVNGKFTTIADPDGSSTILTGVNASGQIIGRYTDASGNTQSFIGNNGVFTTLAAPGTGAGSSTTLGQGFNGGLNDLGQVVGVTKAADSSVHSFVYDSRTDSYTSISEPDAALTFAYGINNSGQVVGYYLTPTEGKAFEYTIQPPTTPPPSVTLYDDTDQPVTQEGRLALAKGVTGGFTFTTGANPGTLADVKLSLVDHDPSDGGSVAVRLFTTTDQSVLDGTKVADLGIVADANLSAFSPTPIDIPITSSITLAPNTTYLVEATGVLGSNAILTQEASDAGTGVAGGQEVLFNASGSGGSSTNSNVGAVVGEVTETVCFVTGTLIRTAAGEVEVEELMVGDHIVTASGAERLIYWIGHRTVDCRSCSRPQEVMPVRIAADAFGENRPARDLLVSPGHAICIDVLGEVLVPAIALVNGATIQQVEVDEVTYWHVELESHDIILAENLPAESYLDMGNRGFFEEADVVDLDAGPDVHTTNLTHADFCRPFHNAGPLVDVVRAQLAKRAEAQGWTLTRDLDMHLEIDGQRVDSVIRGLVARFPVPAGSKDVWLVSPTARPSDTMGTGDSRDLGLCVSSLRIDDGFEAREIAIDNPLLGVGFHEAQEDGRRWTAGRARVPNELWQGCEDSFYLRIELAGAPVPRWTAPTANEATSERQRLAAVA